MDEKLGLKPIFWFSWFSYFLLIDLTLNFFTFMKGKYECSRDMINISKYGWIFDKLVRLVVSLLDAVYYEMIWKIYLIDNETLDCNVR